MTMRYKIVLCVQRRTHTYTGNYLPILYVLRRQLTNRWPTHVYSVRVNKRHLGVLDNNMNIMIRSSYYLLLVEVLHCALACFTPECQRPDFYPVSRRNVCCRRITRFVDLILAKRHPANQHFHTQWHQRWPKCRIALLVD